MSDAWRRELHAEGISVSLIEPGFIASEMCDSELCDSSELPNFSAAVHHALSASYPRARYPVAWVVVMPAWLAVYCDALWPDRFADWVIATVVRQFGVAI